MTLNFALVLAPLAVWFVLAAFGLVSGDGSDFMSGDSDGGDGGD